MTIKNATLYLWVYNGAFGSRPADPSYVLYKEVKTGAEVITFEIAELVKDFIEVNFTGDYTNIAETSWVEWEMVRVYDDDSNDTITGEYIATNGYGYFEDGINPILKKGALLDNTSIYNPSGENIQLPILTGDDGAYKADYYNGNTLLRTDTFGAGLVNLTADTIDYTADSTNLTADMTIVSGSTSAIIIRVIPPATTTRIVVTRNDSVTETIYVKETEECKFSPYKVSFLNKYGVVQDLWFFKRRDDSINISKDDYTQNTLSESVSGVAYSLNKASKMPTNFTASKALKMNTGFVSEDHNEIIQQLLLTERAWIHEDSNVYPIIPKTSSFQYKTNLNDKVMNFTVDFEYAYNEINNIK